jgi:hypothetical protein
MKARIVKVKAERILEINPAPHRLSGTAVRQAEQELQHTDRGELSRRQARTPITRIPGLEVLIPPQPI